MPAQIDGMAKCLRSERGIVSMGLRIAGVSAVALIVANCANQQGGSRTHTSKEIGAFSHPKYGKASPRVVGLDDDAPKGGGRYQVGRPYVVAGRRYVPREKPEGYTVSGLASWYGVAFHGRKTANGEVYDRNSVSAAHPTMPLPSYARVTNLANNHSIVVRVNDRGPYHAGRVLDVSEKTANLLQFRHIGTARVKVDYLGPASLAGSDDTRLIASLSTNGPARAPAGGSSTTMVASVEPVATARPARNSSSLLSFASQEEDETAPVTRASAAPAIPASAPPAQPAVITQTRFTPVVDAPLPPARPFDLDTIGGAATPVAPGSLPNVGTLQRPAGAPLPPARPTDLSFVSMDGGLSRFGPNHAFSSFDRFETLLPNRGAQR